MTKVKKNCHWTVIGVTYIEVLGYIINFKSRPPKEKLIFISDPPSTFSDSFPIFLPFFLARIGYAHACFLSKREGIFCRFAWNIPVTRWGWGRNPSILILHTYLIHYDSPITFWYSDICKINLVMSKNVCRFATSINDKCGSHF